MIEGPRQWLRERPKLVDPAVALLCLALSLPMTIVIAHQQHADIALSVAVLVVSCAPLTVRSRYPVPVVVATMVVGILGYILVPLRGPTPSAVAFALYATAIYTDRRTAWRTCAAVAVVLSSAALVFRPGWVNLPDNLGVLAWTTMAVAVGDAVRSRRELLANALDRAERAEHTKEEEALRRVAEERIRIARDLHDVVAHHITLVNAQAGVAHHLMRTDPEHAYHALERIRDTSRTALDELRATVGLLRSGDDQDASREPAPGLGDLDDLLDSFRHAGLDVVLDGRCPAAEIPPITDLTAYRIIQEALTNTRKHAGPTVARVRLRDNGDVLHVTVTDEGLCASLSPNGVAAGVAVTGNGAGAGTGHGMIGMRERARAVGGTVAAGPLPGKGFRVVAELPLRTGTGRADQDDAA